MGDVRCPYTNKLLAPAQQSPEHIFPVSLGGNDRFCVPADKAANESLGATIDEPFVNQSLIKVFRVYHDLRGHHDTAPVAHAKVKVAMPVVGPQTMQVTLTKGKVDYTLIPSKTPIEADKALFVGSPAKVTDFVMKMRRKAGLQGKPFTVFSEGSEEIKVPHEIDWTADPQVCRRFMAKVAVASFSHAFPDLQPDWHNIRAIRLMLTRGTDIEPGIVETDAVSEQNLVFPVEGLFPHCHVVWLSSDQSGVRAFISVFGVLTAVVRMSGSPEPALPERVFLVDYKEHTVETRDDPVINKVALRPWHLFRSRLMIEKRWFAPGSTTGENPLAETPAPLGPTAYRC